MKIGVQELLIVLLIVLVIFGPAQLAKTIGKSLKGFKKGMEEEQPEKKEQP